MYEVTEGGITRTFFFLPKIKLYKNKAGLIMKIGKGKFERSAPGT